MRIDFEFNELHYRKLHQTFFRYKWTKAKKSQKTNFITALILLFLGAIVKAGDGDIGNLLIFLSLMLFAFCYYSHSRHKKSKELFDKFLELEIKKLSDFSAANYIEFTDTTVVYFDPLLKCELDWSLIADYAVFEDMLLVNSNKGICFAIGEDDLGKGAFYEIISILDQHHKKRGINP